MKILIIGSAPPPLGGVTVFIKRLKHKLIKENNLVDIFDYSREFILLRYLKLFLLFFQKYDRIELNILTLPIAIIFLIFNLPQKTNYIVHSNRNVDNWSRLKRLIFKTFLIRCGNVILVGPHLLEPFIKVNIKLDKNIKIQNAYLPPNLEEEKEILSSYPKELNVFIEEHKPLLMANAFKIVFYNNEDLYGLDLCVQLIKSLKKEFSDIGLVFALPEIGDSDYFNQIKELINKGNLNKNIFFMTGQKEMWPLFNKVDIFLRPTNTDGDSVSVREALYLNCKVIASDVCDRPKNTILFKNRNIDDLTRRCKDVLAV